MTFKLDPGSWIVVVKVRFRFLSSMSMVSLVSASMGSMLRRFGENVYEFELFGQTDSEFGSSTDPSDFEVTFPPEIL
jgi:hypothetical protein